MSLETFSTQAGPIVATLYFSAGIAFVGFLQGIFLTSVLKREAQSYFLYMAIALVACGVPLKIAAFHMAQEPAAAIAYHKLHNTLIVLIPRLIYVWLNQYLGGFGFLFFVLMISVIVSHDWILARSQVSHLTFHDGVTGLPNRELLKDRIDRSFEHSKISGEFNAIVLIDIDRFKSIVAAQGHLSGDQILVAFGGLIQKYLGPQDTVSRLGGNQFAAFVPNAGATPHKALSNGYSIASRVRKDLSEPLKLTGQKQHRIMVSVGVAYGPQNETDGSIQLLQRGESALHSARQSGSGEIATYDRKMGALVSDRVAIEHELHDAIKK